MERVEGERISWRYGMYAPNHWLRAFQDIAQWHAAAGQSAPINEANYLTSLNGRPPSPAAPQETIAPRSSDRTRQDASMPVAEQETPGSVTKEA